VVCAAAMLCASCANSVIKDNPFGDEPGPRAVALPAAVHLDWRGFGVDLDPTVELWANQAHVDLTAVVEGALSKIEGRLHGPSVPITIEAGTYGTTRALGIGGQTDPYTGRVQVSMDLGSSLPLRELLSMWVPMSLAHELAHSKRILDGPGYGETLGEVVVSEGSAEAFVREAFPNAPAVPWVQPLTPVDEMRLWQRLRSQLAAPNDPIVYEDWFVGKDGLPHWAGYRIGYAIARSYLAKHRGVTAAQLAKTPASDVLKGFVP
jgi:Predicted Zn-dependent protease (DUF2268)